MDGDLADVLDLIDVLNEYATGPEVEWEGVKAKVFQLAQLVADTELARRSQR